MAGDKGSARSRRTMESRGRALRKARSNAPRVLGLEPETASRPSPKQDPPRRSRGGVSTGADSVVQGALRNVAFLAPNEALRSIRTRQTERSENDQKVCHIHAGDAVHI